MTRTNNSIITKNINKPKLAPVSQFDRTYQLFSIGVIVIIILLYNYKWKLIMNIVRELEREYKIDQLDGIKININDNTWSLIRKSNTEDIIRISTESNDKQLLEEIQTEMIKKVECCYDEIK